LIRRLNKVRQSNHEALAALDYLMTDVNLSPPPDTHSYKEYHRVHQAQCKQVTDTFEDLRHEVSAPVKVSQWENQLERIRGQIKQLSKDRQCDQVNAFFCQQLNNAGITTQHHRLVNPFVYSNNNRPLAEALRICSLKETAEDIRGRFRESSLQDIELALENNGDAAMQRIAVAKSRSYLQEDRLVEAKLEAGFVAIKLGTQDKKVDLKGQCFWVPASVRHEVRQDEKTGLSRYSFFVYGGVNVQPRVNVINGVNGALKGNAVGGGGFGGGGSGGGSGGGGFGKANRVTVLVAGANKEQVRSMLSEGRLPVTTEQANSLKEVLKTGRMDNIRIHKINTGAVHVACERPGHTSGFQRMSFKLGENGGKVRVVQTAFDDNSKLVHQRPGATKNNLYDIKK